MDGFLVAADAFGVAHHDGSSVPRTRDPEVSQFSAAREPRADFVFAPRTSRNTRAARRHSHCDRIIHTACRLHPGRRYGGRVFHGTCPKGLFPADQWRSARDPVLFRLSLFDCCRRWGVERRQSEAMTVRREPNASPRSRCCSAPQKLRISKPAVPAYDLSATSARCTRTFATGIGTVGVIGYLRQL